MTEREITYAIQARSLLIEGKLEEAYVKSRMRIRELESEKTELLNRVADYSGEIAALMAAKHLFLTQRSFLADVLEDVCIGHKTSGACPLFYRCPAGDLGKSCGEMTKEDWVYTAIEVAND